MKLLLKLLILFFLLTPAFLQPLYSADKTQSDSLPVLDEFWMNGNRRVPIRLLEDRMAILLDPDESVSVNSVPLIPEGTSVVETSNSLVLLETPSGTALTEFLQSDLTEANSGVNSGRFAAVYAGPIADSPLIMSGELIIFPEDDVDQKDVETLLNTQGSRFMKRAAVRQALVFSCPIGPECLELANNTFRSTLVKFAFPNWYLATETHASVNDPLYQFQWHLENTAQSGGIAGEDVDIQTAWDLNVTGDGITIGIVDDSLETNHEDLIANSGGLTPLAPHIDLIDGDSDPNPASAFDRHGTSVAGVAAADGQNTIGVIGASYDAKINGIRLIGSFTTINDIATGLLHNIDHPLQPNDIYNNSWGFLNNAGLIDVDPIIQTALEDGTTIGRGGAGTIYVFSAGNSGAFNDNSNYTSITNSRYTIAVAASDHKGVQPVYSEPGANVLVNAPSSGDMAGSSKVTVDVAGPNGFNNPPPTGNNNYTSIFTGTSSSAALVSGVIALMLEKNTALTWRDVQRILAFTAEQNDFTDSDWLQNGAGYWVNHKYGFGRVDAGAAVAEADLWSNLGAEVFSESNFAVNLPIPDSGGGAVTVSLPMPNLPMNDTETVRVTIDSDHGRWGDLDMKLISPNGTVSQITEANGSTGAQLLGGYPFTSVRHFSEDPNGTWELVIEDMDFNFTGEITTVNLEIFGTFDPPDQFCNGSLVTVDIGAGESPTSTDDVILGTPNIDVIAAGTGDDIVCAGAGADIVNGGGGNDIIFGEDGQDVLFGDGGNDFVYGGPEIDDIDGGSGDDNLFGDAGDDVLFGRAGNDVIHGGDGVDSIFGGPGMDEIHTGAGATVGSLVFVSGGAGPDIINGGPDADDLRGGSGADTIFGGDGPDVITGGVGQDTLSGGDGADDIRGQVSPDTIIGGPGDDVLFGGAGNDQIDGGGGSDDVCLGQSGLADTAVNCETTSTVP